jgi:hypothetical protein
MWTPIKISGFSYFCHTCCWQVYKMEHTAMQYQLQHSLPSYKLPLEATSAQELFVSSFMKWVSMAEQLHTSLSSPWAMPSVGWSDESRFAIWQSEGTNLGLADARRMLPTRMRSANCKVWWRRNNGLGLFFMVWSRLLSSSERASWFYSMTF